MGSVDERRTARWHCCPLAGWLRLLVVVVVVLCGRGSGGCMCVGEGGGGGGEERGGGTWLGDGEDRGALRVEALRGECCHEELSGFSFFPFLISCFWGCFVFLLGDVLGLIVDLVAWWWETMGTPRWLWDVLRACLLLQLSLSSLFLISFWMHRIADCARDCRSESAEGYATCIPCICIFFPSS